MHLKINLFRIYMTQSISDLFDKDKNRKIKNILIPTYIIFI